MTSIYTLKALGITSLIAVTIAIAAAIATPASAAGNGSFTVNPDSLTYNQGGTATVEIVGNADVVTSAAQADFTFDETRFAVTSFSFGPAWSTANQLFGTGGQTQAQAIASANSSGVLENLATFCAPGGCTVAAGPTEFVTVQLNVLNNGGNSRFDIDQALMNDVNGGPVTTSFTGRDVFTTGLISVGGVVETIVGGDTPDGLINTTSVAIGLALALAAAAVGGLGLSRGMTLRKS